MLEGGEAADAFWLVVEVCAVLLCLAFAGAATVGCGGATTGCGAATTGCGTTGATPCAACFAFASLPEPAWPGC